MPSAAQVVVDADRERSNPPSVVPSQDTLAFEIALLAAAREALVRGDRQTARDRLTDYDARAPRGSMRREADILWSRAR
ncbi:MAG TPA: hypothetical protein VM925_13475 [Labilithrix sp.]|nr:hypothetical protein [Labilithrix sp.]